MDMPMELSPPRVLLAAASATDLNAGSAECRDPSSFLGVANVACLNSNVGVAIVLLGIIIAASILLERGVKFVRRVITCPQLKKIVNRVFEEVMIMGFISMTIFALNTTGVLEHLHFDFHGKLSTTERLHFYEFFHFIVFLTMIYFIAIVLLLLFVGTVVPKLVWNMRKNAAESESESGGEVLSIEEDAGRDVDGTMHTDREDLIGMTPRPGSRRFSHREGSTTTTTTTRFPNNARSSMIRPRANSGMDLFQGTRAYSLLLQRYQREGWCFQFNVVKQWHLWKSFEILAYNICQHRSGYIYKNPAEMERLFGVKPVSGSARDDGDYMSYERYHTLCMRNLLHHLSHLHWSAFFILLAITIIPALFPVYAHWVFLGVGGVLLLVNIVIFFKVLRILRGIVDDRLRVITTHEIKRRLGETEEDMFHPQVRTRPPRLRAVALGVRAVIRMQMSALCHRQLHYHDHRFWFNSPQFLLRLFHFATIGQAFYLVWFTLVEWQTGQRHAGSFMIPTMLLLPILALCVITPLTMPSLVLVMSLTGIFVDLNANNSDSGHRPTQSETAAHIRLMRRSYLRSHYSARRLERDSASSALSTGRLSPSSQLPVDGSRSPSAVYLRIYDSPMAAIQAGKLADPTTASGIRSPTGTRSPATMGSGFRREGSSSSLQRQRSIEGEAFVASTGDDMDQTQSESTPVADLSIRTAQSEHFDVMTKWSPRHPRSEMTERAPRAPREDQTATDLASIPLVSSPSFRGFCSKYGGYPDDD